MDVKDIAMTRIALIMRVLKSHPGASNCNCCKQALLSSHFKAFIIIIPSSHSINAIGPAPLRSGNNSLLGALLRYACNRCQP
jgi:hypothetical protein